VGPRLATQPPRGERKRIGSEHRLWLRWVVVVVSSPSADTEYSDPRATVTRAGPRPDRPIESNG